MVITFSPFLLLLSLLFLHQNNTHDNNKTEDVITVKGGGLGGNRYLFTSSAFRMGTYSRLGVYSN